MAYFTIIKYISSRPGCSCTYLWPMSPWPIIIRIPYDFILLQLLVELLLIHSKLKSIQSLRGLPLMPQKRNSDRNKRISITIRHTEELQ